MSAARRRAPRGPTAALGSRFDDRFLRKLESLALTIRARRPGDRTERRSRRVGAGLEFADHRDYVPGDDLRYLDWNLYGRLERLAVRLFEEDEDLSIYVLFDASASMAMGRPPKLDLAIQVGAALAYVGLSNLDRVAVTALGAEAAGPPPARGKARILPILRYLDAVRAAAADLEAVAGGSRARVPVAAARPEARAGGAGLRFLRPGRGARRAGARPAQPPRSDRHPDLRPRRAGAAAARRPAALRRRDRRGARPDHLPARCSPTTRKGTRRCCASSAAIAASAPSPASPSSSDQPFDAVVLRMFRAGGLLG